MQDLKQIVLEIKDEFSRKYESLICEIDFNRDKKLIKGFVLLRGQEEYLVEKFHQEKVNFKIDIKVLSDRDISPEFGFGKAKKAIIDVFKKSALNLEVLSPRGINQLRSTQIKKEDFAFRVLYKQDDWFLIQLLDDTLGWIREEDFENTGGENTDPQITETKEKFLKKYLNTPYLPGGTTEKGIDCSGLSQRFYLEVKGEIIPKYSQDQQSLGFEDLIFAKSKDKNISHVGVSYKDKVLHACLREKKVILEDINDFKKYYNSSDRNIHIVGLSGAEGISIAHFLVKEGYKNITAHDFCEEADFSKNLRLYNPSMKKAKLIKMIKNTKNLPIKFCYKDKYLDGILDAELIFVPQSWYLYPQNKVIEKAIQKGTEMKSMMQLYLQLAKCKTIGITGSNGKSTVSNLVYHVLKQHKSETYLVGNDRQSTQILDKIHSLKKDDYLVMEISNRHLKMDLPNSPHISIITNITQNHLNEHKSFQDYIDTKFKIFSKQTKKDYLVINSNDEILKKIDPKSTPAKISCFDSKDHLGFDLTKTELQGKHNEENIVAVIQVCRILNVPDEVIQRSIDSFKPLSKRTEKIMEVKGISFINDLSSTTPESTIKAIKSFPGKEITLILGGENKDLNLKEAIKEIPKYCQNVIYHEGSVSKEIIPQIEDKVLVIKSNDIKETIHKSMEITKRGGVVLFSPIGEKFISGILDNRKLANIIKKVLG